MAAPGFLVQDAYVTKLVSGGGAPEQFSVLTSGANISSPCRLIQMQFKVENAGSVTALGRAYSALLLAYSTNAKVDIWGSNVATCDSAFSVDLKK